MPKLVILPDGDEAWPDIPAKREYGLLIDAMGNEGAELSMAPLKGGMVGGKTSVTIRIDLPDGRTILTETSLRLLKAAVRIFEAHFGNADAE